MHPVAPMPWKARQLALIIFFVLPLTLALAAPHDAQPAELSVQSADEADEFGADWPPGPGREDTGYLCNACHSLAIVKQQGLSRDTWDELLDWMTEEQGMPELEAEERGLILDYLSTNFGIDRPRN